MTAIKPKDTPSRPYNLFDDSNKLDNAWVGIAKDYLNKRGKLNRLTHSND